MAQNGKKCTKWSKIAKNVQNGLKSSRMIQNGQKWSKWSKMVKNGGPDLKRAQRTGLGARRARRTKSRGPKGLQLEVGARRAPRLLVFDICFYLHEMYYVSDGCMSSLFEQEAKHTLWPRLHAHFHTHLLII